MFWATWFGMFSFDLFLFGELHGHSLHLKQFYLWQCWWWNTEDGRQDSGSRLCCNPYTEHTEQGDDDLQMFDDIDAVNPSLPVVENTVHDLVSHQASWYYEGSKGYWWSSVSKSFFVWKLSDVGAFCRVTFKVTWQNVPTALNLKKHSVNTICHRKILSLLSYYCGHCINDTQRNLTQFH